MQNRLTTLEMVIESERRSFYKVGKALREIRDERLYRELFFDSFERYVKKRWDMGKSHAYRLIEASRVIDNLSPIGDVLPENEAQLRPFGKLEPADQRKLWGDFLSEGLDLTARNIGCFAGKFANKRKRKERIDLTQIISPDYYEAVMGMLEQIRLAGQDKWRATSREAGLFWLMVMKEKIIAKG
jgi:hypothetical protein